MVFFGTVLHLKITGFDKTFVKNYPDLFVDGEPIGSLVMKITNDFRFVKSSIQKEILMEKEATEHIQNVIYEMQGSYFEGSRIFYAFEGDENISAFMVKPLMKNTLSPKELGKTQKKLSPLQIERLKDIFYSAELLYTKYKIPLDIRPDNLGWNQQTERWELFEIVPIQLQSDAYISSGFEGFVDFFEQSL